MASDLNFVKFVADQIDNICEIRSSASQAKGQEEVRAAGW